MASGAAGGGEDREHRPRARREDDEVGLGGAHAAGVPVEEPRLHGLLDLVQAVGQGRLRGAEHRRGLEEAAVQVEGVDHPQLRQPQALIEEAAGHRGGSDRGPAPQRASGSGRICSLTTLARAPLPPSPWKFARVPEVVHSPRPFHPAAGSSMRPSTFLLKNPIG